MEIARKYAIVVLPLSDDDGGGFVARVPDLPGCFGDGKTPESAVRDAEKAIVEWIDEYTKMGRSVPDPGSVAEAFRKHREGELKFLMECVQRLREVEKGREDLEDRIASIEREIRFLVDTVENSDGWERFHIIQKSTKRMSQELLC
jgi:antitoxin HicB